MLSYQHAYHAGNFADVHKHICVYSVSDYLLRKKSSITFIDTHAGRGSYPLAATETARLQEYREGVERLWMTRDQLNNPLLIEWLDAIASLQSSAKLERYPGSPWWLGHRLREQDCLTVFELHPGEHRHLSEESVVPKGREKVLRRVHGDGLAGLVRSLPTTTPRVCALIDPSFERKDEYQEVVEAIIQAMRKARHAVVMLWYPLLPAGRHHAMLETFAGSGIRKIWRSEILREPVGESAHGMYGSGMLVINPPWGLDERLGQAYEHWLPLLGDQAQHRAEWLVEE
ncbi:23S rRNA (adenine(2030)-N(6))-methyltransferase RlmJ [Halomonas binhaiensis]|uniref:Ribosomal RNA large subunit methyltransferase J n=1 Tax=Halomonas binhaiensis TaxID=2562282 RepID=A0A5C1NMK5_9GAMM|nr:23S rRNA (adenine(2030)-N(6))-methyltransferase RlmJ [Halomonas binhaiensis]QEM83668.1 23S rRNA (adenine(2030)-N(6))-methyltransferase RlmJ [Halomonas binhaiensis]